MSGPWPHPGAGEPSGDRPPTDQDPPPQWGPPPPGGPPPVWGPPSPWGPPHHYYGYGGVREHPQGTVILVLGVMALVVGFVCGIGLLLGPVAWIMGQSALNEIKQNPAAYSNRGIVQAGWICGIIATVLLALGVVFVVILAATG